MSAKERDGSIELFRCICMFGVVCIHAFTWTGVVSRVPWAICNPSLIGFVMISAWFGIHFKWVKIVRLLGIVFFCVIVTMLFTTGGIARCKGYWYVWAYVFMMMFAPIVDTFVEQCVERKVLINAFASVAILLWGWIHLAVIEPFSQTVPKVAGFDDCSGVVILCIYILTRLMRRLGWTDRLAGKPIVLWTILGVSGLFVVVGFRHMHSIFAFAFALSVFLIVRSVPLSENVSNIFRILGPSMFSVYLLHLPFGHLFPVLWNHIYDFTHFPNVVCQVIVAVVVFLAAVAIDMPRRLLLSILSSRTTCNYGVSGTTKTAIRK